MKKPRILVVGSSNTDMIIKVGRIPRPGETLIGGRFVTAAGGKGANQAVAAARAGADVTFVARVGRDMFGDRTLAGLKADKINTRHIQRDPKAPSGVALIFVSESGENSIAVASGANEKLLPKDVQNAEAAFKNADMLVTQLENPVSSITAAARLAKKHGVPVILNPAPAPAAPLPASLLKLVSIITPNETEAEFLSGIKVTDTASAEAAARVIMGKGVKNVIITLGSKGAYLCNAETSKLVPVRKVKAVDTTAAGDTFNGALAVALSEGRSLADAVCFANAAATISVTRLGAQPSAPTRAEIERLMRKK
ncbi:ribokinase [Ereboglobus luteus]|uniref:Ribokinase n=1 Tax=Ereboglobus luteus TaxID=1796921 RepID=A0A2U8E2M7_9BACT|nr:ribokinase [Ereboglobus luteus]AWI08954.1 ribokinase [Ereboglobus luteus]